MADGLEPATHRVADNSVANGLAHDKTEARRTCFFREDDVRHTGCARAPHTPPDDCSIVSPASDALWSREHSRSSALRRELGAALAAACVEDGATGAGAHTGTETVLLGATTVVGLESALAHSVLTPGGSVTGIYGAGDVMQGCPKWAQVNRNRLRRQAVVRKLLGQPVSTSTALPLFAQRHATTSCTPFA